MREDVVARQYGMVLDHKLFVEYYNFKCGKNHDRELVGKILSYYHNDFLTNIGQYEHNRIDIGRNIRSVLTQNGLTHQNLEELAVLTTYKIILTDGRTHFPYVNIDEGRFQPALTTFYEGDAERAAALDYLKNLCQGAKKSIFSYDKIDAVHRAELQRTHDKLMFKNIGDVPPHHDRYLIIDDSIEVVLTSGFEYLQNQRKEISLVIRPVKDLHGLR